MKQKPVLNILTYVLDDHADTLENIEEVFKINNFSGCKFFTDSDEFISALGTTDGTDYGQQMHAIRENAHIVIIDYWLKGERNGLDICKMIIKEYPRCFLIIMSSQVDQRVTVDFMNSGADRYVMKSDADWLEYLIKFVKEGMDVVQEELNYYFELLTLKKSIQEASHDR
jgi:DNA-binding NarL/FixJ family response regulator